MRTWGRLLGGELGGQCLNGPLGLQGHKRAHSYMFSAMDAQSESPRLDMRRGGGCVGESFGASVSIGCSGTDRSPDTIVLRRPCCWSAKSALSKHLRPLLCTHHSRASGPQRYDKTAFIDRSPVQKPFQALLLLQNEVYAVTALACARSSVHSTTKCDH